MASASDRLVGAFLIAVALIVFGYYSIWVLVTPLLSPSDPIQSLFPAREWAFILPTALLVLGVSGIGAFLASVMIAQGKKKKTA